eukprot:gene7132-7703_t
MKLASIVIVLIAIIVYFKVKTSVNTAHDSYEKVREELRKSHDEIDTKFHHKDLLIDQTNWHYVDEGNESGPVVLFIHGFPESWYVWRYILPMIDKRYRLIAIDLKGFGRSNTSSADYEWHSIGREINGFMKSLNIDKYFVVSHDWGTLLGSVLVHDHQPHILGYIRMQVELSNKHPYEKTFGKYIQFLRRPQFFLFQFPWLMELIMADRRKFLINTYQQRMTTKFQQADIDYLTYEYLRKDLVNVIFPYVHHSNWDFPTAMDKICYNKFSFPVLQLQANQDHTQPNEWFDHVPKDCKNVKLEWIAGASHFDMFDDPKAIAQSINRFLMKYFPKN